MRGAFRLASLAVAFLAFALAGPQAHAAPAGSTAEFKAFEAAIQSTKAAMMGDPRQALQTAQKASALARALPASKEADIARATAGWLEGEALIGINDTQAAAGVIDAALKIVERVAPGTKLNGDLLRSHGAIAASAGNVVAALKDYQMAFKVFESAGVARSQAIALQDIGQIYWEAGDYAKVLDYYSKAIETFRDDPSLNLSTHNNVAEVYRKQGRYDEAAKEYRQAIKDAKALGSPMLEARILANLADSETEAGNFDSAERAADEAMRLVSRGDAVGWRSIVLGSAAKVAAARGQTARAAALFDRAFAGVDLARSDMSFHDYHEIASQVYEKAGNGALALRHLKAYQRLDSEAAKLTASIASQLAASQFDFATQDLKISRLEKDRLARQVAMERQRARFRTTLFLGLGGAGSAVLIVLLIGYISVRRSRNEVRAANDNLTVTNVKLEKALLAKTEFLAMTSHEIRTPLNGILGMTQVLLADRKLAPDLRERVDVMNSAGTTMKALVDDILDLAKMESDELTVVSEPTELRAILREASQLWRGHAEAKALTLTVDADNAPHRILSDGARLRQIIFNLMSNAVKFTLRGEIALRVATETGKDGAEMLVIAVRDTGIGIPAEKQEEIFEAFKQVDGGTTRQFSGTGLGLTICRRIATALGGTVTVESAENSGSTFIVRLPLLRAELVSDGEQPGEAEDILAERSALALLPLADDNVLLKMGLMSSFALMDMVACHEDARERLAAGQYDLVIVDPLALGDDAEAAKPVLRTLVEAAAEKGAQLSLLVATDGPLAIAEAIMLGAAQIVVKPIEMDALLEALATLFGDEPEPLVAPSLMATG